MQVSDAVRLRHMLDAAREAVAFATGRSRDDLLRDRVLTLALLKCIEIVGEGNPPADVACPPRPAHAPGGCKLDLVDVRGFEPLASALRTPRSGSLTF